MIDRQFSLVLMAALGLGRAETPGEFSFLSPPPSSSVLSPLTPVFRGPWRYAASEAARSEIWVEQAIF